MMTTKLLWYFAIPFCETKPGQYVTPDEVSDHPDLHPGEYRHTPKADCRYPIDLCIDAVAG